MTTEIDWTEFASNWKKFDTVGDSVVGLIVATGMDEYMGKRYPVLTLQTDDGDTVNVPCTQKGLQARLAQLRPQVGVRIAISYQGDGDARPGQNPPKLFEVAVGETPAPVAPAAAPVAAPVAPVVPTAVVPAPAAVAAPSTVAPSAADLL